MESGWKPNSSASSSKSPLVGSDTSAHTTLRSTPQRSLSSSAGKSCVNSFASLSRHVVVITPLSFLLYVSAPSSILGRQDLGAKKIHRLRRDAVRPSKSTSWFTNFAKWTARAAGRPAAFAMAASVIVTFLMVFLIQNTQNRDTEALQVKLDELIRVTEGAHLVLLDLEELDDKQLDKVRANYEKLATKAREDLKLGKDDTGVPDLGDEDEDQAFLEGKGSKAKGKKKKK